MTDGHKYKIKSTSLFQKLYNLAPPIHEGHWAFVQGGSNCIHEDLQERVGSQFLAQRLLTSLAKFNPKNIVVFYAIVNGTVFFFSFSGSSLLVPRKPPGFCMWIFVF